MMIKLTTYWTTFISISASSRQLIGMGWGRRSWSLQLCQSLGSRGTRAISRSTRRPIGSTCPRQAQKRSGCSGTFEGDSANGLSDQLLREMSKGGSGWRRWSDNEEVHLNYESWSWRNNTIMVLDLRIGTMRGHTHALFSSTEAHMCTNPFWVSCKNSKEWVGGEMGNVPFL